MNEELEEIITFLKTKGFEPYLEDSESHHYLRRKTEGGVILYGWEFMRWDGKWKDPTKPAFYFYSGLGDHESYGFKREAEDIGEVMQIEDAIGCLV